MKKKVVVALSLCGLVLSLPASGMLRHQVRVTCPPKLSDDQIRRFLEELPRPGPTPYYPDFIHPVVSDTESNRVRVIAAIARTIPDLPYIKAFLGGDRTTLNPESMAIPVPEGNTDYPVRNGLCGLDRDIILRLLDLIRYRTLAIKQLMAVSANFLSWRDHKYFVRVRYASKAGPALNDLKDAAASLEYQSLLHRYNKLSLEAYPVKAALATYNIPLLWHLFDASAHRPLLLRCADLPNSCLYDTWQWAYRSLDFVVGEIPLDLVNSSLPILAKRLLIPQLTLDQARQITYRALLSADCPEIFGQLYTLTRELSIPYPDEWDRAARSYTY